MKFQLETAPGRNVFTGYGEGYVAINRERHECGLIVGGDRLLFDWPARWEDLNAGHFEFLRTLQPEIVLLGTGPTQKFPHPALPRCLYEARIGLEIMTTDAACRTYNILVAEGRNAFAAIWMP
jgi:uncharacterized protein